VNSRDCWIVSVGTACTDVSTTSGALVCCGAGDIFAVFCRFNCGEV
jgi:hypothetical protein